jgi:uncharacterized PurR-regulated membrane protein YhhQ (DUF165 family)
VGSTVVGQAVDSAVFISVAFAGRLPWGALLQIAATLYLFKVAYEVAATPLTYTIVRWLKRVEGVEVFDRTTDFSPFRL